MSSQLYYKFKSEKNYSLYKFDGPSIPVWKFKNDVMSLRKIKASDSDLVISSAQSGEIFSQDAFLIPRNASLVLNRIPARNVRQFPTSKLQRTDQSVISYPVEIKSENIALSEGDKIKALQIETDRNLNINQDLTFESQGAIRTKRFQSKLSTRHTKQSLVNPNTVCYRCGQLGHKSDSCPLNIDNDKRLRIKRSTGIPKTFLKNITDVENIIANPSLIVKTDGNVAIALPNENAWKESVEHKHAIKSAEIPEHLRCKLCLQIFTDPVITTCCNETVCSECLMVGEGVCPFCSKRIDLDDLKGNEHIKKECEKFMVDKKGS